MGCQFNRIASKRNETETQICRKQLLRKWHEIWNKTIYMIDGRKLRFDLTFLNLTNIIYFVKQHCFSLPYYRPSRADDYSKNSRAESDQITKCDHTHTQTALPMYASLVISLSFFCSMTITRAQWQRCVSPFVTVVTNAVTRKV